KMLHTLLLYLLFAMKWMTVESVDYGPPRSCCRATSTKTVPVENIVKFSYQVGCHVEAIKFLTKMGNYICSDPESAWAKETIDQLTRKPPILPLPPTWTTPSTTTPTTPATTERNKGKRAPSTHQESAKPFTVSLLSLALAADAETA
uniref:Chemokine interleukin-8-like domain-containing protein n=1 Tax=Astyanax mexicanus TaxID=7994 RepID=A0A8B9KUK4_ASTMX